MLPLENRLSSRSDTGREELLPGVRAHLCGSHLSVRSTVCPRSRCERSLGHCPPSGPRISGNWSCGSAVAAVMRGAAWEMEFNPTEDPPPPPDMTSAPTLIPQSGLSGRSRSLINPTNLILVIWVTWQHPACTHRAEGGRGLEYQFTDFV